MKLLIVAATLMEIEPLIDSSVMQKCRLMITGVGAVATTYHLTRLLVDDKAELIIQAGIAGAFDDSLALGTVVMVKQDRFADLGVEENSEWKDVFDLGLVKADDEPFHNAWLVNKHEKISKQGLPLVSGITINEITTSPSRIQGYRNKYQPLIESMEGAALHFVCLQEGIPFIQLRAISNYVGERDKSKWNMRLAIANLNRALIKIIEDLA